MRADSETTIRSSVPVFQVVRALKPGHRPVRNLIVNITAPIEALSSLIVEGDVYLVVLKFRIAAAPGAALFPVKHVDGHMLGTKTLEQAQILAPDLKALVRQTRNEIDTDVLETGIAKRFEIFNNVCGAVQ